MTRERKEVFVDLPVTKNPNFKQYRNTNIYLSKMGDVVRINRWGKEEKAIIHRARGESHFYCNDDGLKRKRYVARSVYETFKGKVPEGYKVIHVDQIKTNNNINNLKMVTTSEATIHVNKGRTRKMIHNLETGEVYRNIQECADALGYCTSVISKVIRGKYDANTDLKLRYVTEDEALLIDKREKKIYSVYKDGDRYKR